MAPDSPLSIRHEYFVALAYDCSTTVWGGTVKKYINASFREDKLNRIISIYLYQPCSA